MADFDYTQSSKEVKKKFKPKKELRKIIKEHKGPENNKTYNEKFDKLGSEGLSSTEEFAKSYGIEVAKAGSKIVKHLGLEQASKKIGKAAKKATYPGGLGPDADEGSPDTGPWDEDWN